jgi:dolichyl-diphosphooligosaccharide--protein glycosyltransferase
MGIKQTLTKGLKGSGKLRIQVSNGAILTYTALIMILFIAFTIRVLPMRWEIPSGNLGLNEFDPYYQYSLTNHMVKNGLLSPYWPTPWVNYQQFYPSGLDMAASLPSLPMTTATLYSIISGLGVNIDLMSFCSIMAPLMGMMAVLLMFFVGKDMAGKTAGLLSALVLALMPSVIQRSSLGFFDTETVGVVSMLVFIFMFMRAIEPTKSLRSMMLYSIGAGAAVAYFSAGWGAAYFLIDLVALFAFVMVLIKRYSQRLLLSYSITFGLGLFIAIAVPFLSPSYVSSAAVLPVAAVFVVLCIAEVFHSQISSQTKTIIAAAFLIVSIGGLALLAGFGDLSSIAGKFISVLNPFARSSQPLIESVAEHRIAAWGSMYYELGIGILFFLSGIYFTVKNPTNRNVFLMLFGLTTLYFASSMVRLLVLLAPAYALLVAVGALGVVKPFYTLLKEAGTQTAIKSKRHLKRVGKEYSVIAIGIVFLLLVTNFAFSPQTGGEPRAYGAAYNPIAISAASLPIAANQQVPQWLNMLSYTRENLQSTTVVASWWDYGYWLGIFGNVTTLCDNSTVNSTQIENVGYAMMANENQSLKMLSQYNTSYLLVFTTLQLTVSSSNTLTGEVKFAGYGDEGKWVWMADISGNAKDRFIKEGFMDANYNWSNKTAFGYNATSGQTTWNTMGLNSTIYKLMSHAEKQWATKYSFTPAQTADDPTYFTPTFISGLEIDPTTAAQQYGTLVPLVCLYKINWDAYYAANGQP